MPRVRLLLSDTVLSRLRSVGCRVLLPAALVSMSAAGVAQAPAWVGTWAAAPLGVPAGNTNAGKTAETIRDIVHVSIGGESVRITLSNEFGTEPLTISAATLALRASGNELRGPAVPILFSGKPTVTIPPGALVQSDAVAFKLPALKDVAVSLFVPVQPITTLTLHGFSDTTNFIAPGDQTSAAKLTGSREAPAWRYLKDIDVSGGATGAGRATGAVVCFGDSITDGVHSSKDANLRWPDLLAKRLLADRKTATLGVLNEGIGGNRILHDGTGPSAVARFDRDVLSQSGVRYLVVLEGINDIGRAYGPNSVDPVTATELIAAYTQMAKRAHDRGIKVYGGTLTPYRGAGYFTPAGEAVRLAVNKWIRSTTDLDGFIDFEKAVRDGDKPDSLDGGSDSGDHLHPSDDGYDHMAQTIDLKLFTK